MIYLASPHSDEDPINMEIRYLRVLKVWKEQYFDKGIAAYSPIIHCHEVAKIYKDMVGKGFEYFQDFDEHMIKLCDELHVVQIDGWRESRGVKSEIIYAHHCGKPVKYI